MKRTLLFAAAALIASCAFGPKAIARTTSDTLASVQTDTASGGQEQFTAYMRVVVPAHSTAVSYIAYGFTSTSQPFADSGRTFVNSSAHTDTFYYARTAAVSVTGPVFIRGKVVDSAGSYFSAVESVTVTPVWVGPSLSLSTHFSTISGGGQTYTFNCGFAPSATLYVYAYPSTDASDTGTLPVAYLIDSVHHTDSGSATYIFSGFDSGLYISYYFVLTNPVTSVISPIRWIETGGVNTDTTTLVDTAIVGFIIGKDSTKCGTGGTATMYLYLGLHTGDSCDNAVALVAPTIGLSPLGEFEGDTYSVSLPIARPGLTQYELHMIGLDSGVNYTVTVYGWSATGIAYGPWQKLLSFTYIPGQSSTKVLSVSMPTDELVVYPNPAHGSIVIRDGSALQRDVYTVMNMSGSVVATIHSAGRETTLSCEGFAPGTYFVKKEGSHNSHVLIVQ